MNKEELVLELEEEEEEVEAETKEEEGSMLCRPASKLKSK